MDMDIMKYLQEYDRKVKAFTSIMGLCQQRGHWPYKQKVIIPYDPHLGESVSIECRGCNMVYERPPTKQEVDNYYKNSKEERENNSTFYSSLQEQQQQAVILHL